MAIADTLKSAGAFASKATAAGSTEDIRKDKLWLVIVPKIGAKALFKQFKDSLVSSTTSYITRQLTIDEKADLATIKLPLTGAIPIAFFKNEYQKMLPDLDQSTRLLLSVTGETVRHGASIGRSALKGAGKYIPDVAENAGRSLLGYVDKFGSFIASFGGYLDAPLRWNSFALDPINAGGMIDFESTDDFQYYKSAEIFLTYMTTPVPTGTYSQIKEALETLQGKSTNQTQALEGYTYNPPSASCDVAIYSSLKDSVPLLYLPNMLLTSSAFTPGTEDGRGIDNLGIPRLMRYAVSFTPSSLASVVDGLRATYNATHLPTVDLTYKAEIAPKAQYARGLVQQLTTPNLTVAAAGMVLARAVALKGYANFAKTRLVLAGKALGAL